MNQKQHENAVKKETEDRNKIISLAEDYMMKKAPERILSTGINISIQTKIKLTHDKPVSEVWEVYLLRIAEQAKKYRNIMEVIR